METDSYHNQITAEVKKQYEIIGRLKPINIPLASDVADRIEGLLSVLNSKLIKSGLADFIREKKEVEEIIKRKMNENPKELIPIDSLIELGLKRKKRGLFFYLFSEYTI